MKPTPSGDRPASLLQFGRFRFDPVRREVLDEHGPLRLGGRAFQLLEALLEEPGRLCSHEALRARVWPDTVVEETSLRVHMSALRRALGDGLDGARYIENQPGRGYIFVAELRPLEASAAAEARAPEWLAQVRGLPARLTRPIGRCEVIAEIGALCLQQRLVSVVGTGGLGKTTVALAVAAGLNSRFAQGSVFVDLSRLSDPALVGVELGLSQGLDLRPGDPRSGLDASLEHALRDKHLLIVLDNCEHLVGAAATAVDRLLRTCPQVHFIATSREPLDVETEWIYRLPPLDIPPPDEPMAIAELLACPAIQLFVERARATCGAFELDEGNAGAVRQLCGFLDGIPLAIELAAARVDSLGVQGLLLRLENAFELLTRGRRTALSRHRTLQAVMDWSHDLLSATEQAVLRRLSVFRGAVSLEGAIAVASDAELPRQAVIDAVLSLSAKSLLARESADDDVLLHRMLYITRLFAGKRLAAGPELADVKRRHARFIRDCLLASQDAGLGQLQDPWTSALAASIADLRAAISWTLLEENDLALGLEITAESMHAYYDTGLTDEYRGHLFDAVGKLKRAGMEDSRVEFKLQLGLSFLPGNTLAGEDEGIPTFSRIRALVSKLASVEDHIEALFGMCVSSYGRGHYLEVLALCGEVRDLAQGELQPLSVSISDRMSALALHALGRHDESERVARGVLAFKGACVGRRFLSGIPFGVSMRIRLARIQWLRGEFQRARTTAREAGELAADAHVFARCQVLALADIPLAIWSGDRALAVRRAAELHDHASRCSLPYWQGCAQLHRCVAEGRAVSALSAEGWLLERSLPLMDAVSVLRSAQPAAATLERVRQGQVGWCGPEVLRLAALADHATRGLPLAQCLARLQQALEMSVEQGARFWSLRLLKSLCELAPPRDPLHGAARERLRSLLAAIDDGSSMPDLIQARMLVPQSTMSPA